MNVRMGNIFIAVSFACAAMGILAPDALAAGCTWKEGNTTYVDEDGDGNPESATEDADGDGTPEKAWRDHDDDGDWDAEYHNPDDDKLPNGSADWDSAKIDTDTPRNDKYDHEWTDTNGDGVPQKDEVTKIQPEEATPVGPRPQTAPEDKDCCEDGGWPCPDLWPLPLFSIGVPGVSEWGLIVMTLLGLTGMAIKFGRRRSALA